MPHFKSTVHKTIEDKINERLLELFETTVELKDFFNLILPKKSLVKTLIDIDSYTDPTELCKILTSYLGEHFFYYIGKIQSDVDEEDQSKEAKYIIREKILKQICKKAEDPEAKEKQIIDEFYETHPKLDSSVRELSNVVRLKNNKGHDVFLSGQKWQNKLSEQILLLPKNVVSKPEAEPKAPETIALFKRQKLKRLYDYQTQALREIHNLLSEDTKNDLRQKRILVNIPTGAGKTRLSVESIVEWLNLREEDKIPNAMDQQKNGRIIFWFASTNELCEQAASEFEHIYSQIGAAGLVNLTRLFGADRRSLQNILYDKPGTHIVVTNLEHFEDFLAPPIRKNGKVNEDGQRIDTGLRYRIDWYAESEYFQFISKQTIAIIIDEAHEVTSEGYQSFLGAMGFDFSARKESKNNINRNNIVLVGLTATAYKGSGIITTYRCLTCDKILKNKEEKNKHSNLAGHSRIEIIKDNEKKSKVQEMVKNSRVVGEDPILYEFLKKDEELDPDYYKKLDRGTKLMHKIFAGVYVPIPQKARAKSKPSAIIDAPISALVGDNVKLSAIHSFDNNTEIQKYKWQISKWGSKTIEQNQIEFYHQFTEKGEYSVKLTVTNQNGVPDIKNHDISVNQNKSSKKHYTGSLEDSKEFYEILEELNILCKVIHGVIDGPHLNIPQRDLKRWQNDKADTTKINVAVEYNQKICDIVNKCINTYKRKRVLLFANSVRHSQELMLVLKVKYGLKAESVDGKTNPGIRRKIIKEFREGKVQVLCNFGVLTAGFDVPKIDTLMICRETGRNALITQMIGRGQRGTVAGGTPDLWLITSYFPKPQMEESSIKLGWEALAENWGKFPSEIKEYLGIRDFTYESQVSEEKQTKPSKSKSHQIVTEPIENLTLRCLTCDTVTKGLENCLVFYGYEPKIEPKYIEIIKNSLKHDEFPKHCKICRKIRKIAKTSNDPVVKYIAENHNFNPIFSLTMLFTYTHQQKSDRQKLKDLSDDLFLKCKKILPKNYFNIRNKIFLKLQNDGILVIKNNLDLEFKKIIELDAIKEIIDILHKSEKLTQNLNSLLNEHRSSKTKTQIRKPNPIKDHFKNLKKKLGHSPTRRQFMESIDAKLKRQLSKDYSGNYKKFLKDERIILKDDLDLKDSLYDEYFEKCIKEGKKITRQELDEHSEYRIEDYEDMWGSFEKFENRMDRDQSGNSIVNNVLENYVEKRQIRDQEFEEISKDLDNLKKKLGQNYNHFDEIWQHGNLRIFRYIIQIKISHLKYLDNYHGNQTGQCLHLISDYFRLKKFLKTIPTQIQFTSLTGTETTAYFMKVLNSKFDKLLELIDENEKVEDSEHENKMKKLVLEKLRKFDKTNGKEKTIIFIDSNLDPNDELSVQIHAFYPNKTELEKLIYSDPSS